METKPITPINPAPAEAIANATAALKPAKKSAAKKAEKKKPATPKKKPKKKTPATHWNYRVLAFKSKTELFFRICEVYYKKGKPDGYIENKAISAESRVGLVWVVEKIVEGIGKPVLWGGKKFPQPYKETSGKV